MHSLLVNKVKLWWYVKVALQYEYEALDIYIIGLACKGHLQTAIIM